MIKNVGAIVLTPGDPYINTYNLKSELYLYLPQQVLVNRRSGRSHTFGQTLVWIHLVKQIHVKFCIWHLRFWYGL